MRDPPPLFITILSEAHRQTGKSIPSSLQYAFGIWGHYRSDRIFTLDDRISAELSVSILPEGPTYPLIMSDRSGAPKEEGPTVEASHHPEIKVDPHLSGLLWLWRARTYQPHNLWTEVQHMISGLQEGQPFSVSVAVLATPCTAYNSQLTSWLVIRHWLPSTLWP